MNVERGEGFSLSDAILVVLRIGTRRCFWASRLIKVFGLIERGLRAERHVRRNIRNSMNPVHAF